MQNKTVCIFVDGENLRYAIGDLFPSFDRTLYLPKADWSKFFDWIACEAAGKDADRVRTYWYVVQNVDFTPFALNSLRKDKILLQKVLARNEEYAVHISAAVDTSARDVLMEKIVDELIDGQRIIENRFKGWTHIQDGIASGHMAVEFRRAGYIRYNLLEREFGSEKAVDVKLATDLITLKDIYDVAVIVSGDQDYVPAVEAIKDFGKRTVNVAFQKEDGHLMPGGARRLNQATDWSIEMKHADLKGFLNL